MFESLRALAAAKRTVRDQARRRVARLIPPDTAWTLYGRKKPRPCNGRGVWRLVSSIGLPAIAAATTTAATAAAATTTAVTVVAAATATTVVAATTTAAAVATATAATTAVATTTVATAATTAAEPTAATAGAALLALLGFVDPERPAIERATVHALDRLGGFLRSSHGYERETARAAGLAVRDQVDITYGSEFLERGTDAFSIGVERKISNVQTSVHRLLDLAQETTVPPGRGPWCSKAGVS
jgi:hypothetical protein